MSSPRSSTVPEGFREEVTRAVAGKHCGDLELLGEESRGFEWELEGLRLVARAQFNLQSFQNARQTWEAIRRSDPGDEEAPLMLAAISQRLKDSTDLVPERYVPQHRATVLLFTGHRIDAPGRTQPRFPANKEPEAKEKITESIIRELESRTGSVHGIAGGASGGDILFHEICGALNIPTVLYLALPRDDYVAASVRDSGPDWVDRFDRLYEKLPKRVLSASEELPAWLKEKPRYSIWQRNNLWTLYNAIAGGDYLAVIALWDGEAGEGPGGTQDMVQRARNRGAKVNILDTKSTFGLG